MNGVHSPATITMMESIACCAEIDPWMPNKASVEEIKPNVRHDVFFQIIAVTVGLIKDHITSSVRTRLRPGSCSRSANPIPKSASRRLRKQKLAKVLPRSPRKSAFGGNIRLKSRNEARAFGTQ